MLCKRFSLNGPIDTRELFGVLVGGDCFQRDCPSITQAVKRNTVVFTRLSVFIGTGEVRKVMYCGLMGNHE